MLGFAAVVPLKATWVFPWVGSFLLGIPSFCPVRDHFILFFMWGIFVIATITKGRKPGARGRIYFWDKPGQEWEKIH